MGDDFHFLGIIFFAMVAAFLVWRLYGVLGRRTGSERPPSPRWGGPAEAAGDNVVDLATARREGKEAPAPVVLPEEPAVAAGPLAGGVAAIRALDPRFTPEAFLSGSRVAFEMILTAYASGDKKCLEPLVSPEVFHAFASAIDAREHAGETLRTEIIKISEVSILDAKAEGSVALVTVRFVSAQVNDLRDREGRSLDDEGPSHTTLTDDWTFRRDLRSRNPNWQVVATHSPLDSDQKD